VLPLEDTLAGTGDLAPTRFDLPFSVQTELDYPHA
jgi:hypothetical protein